MFKRKWYLMAPEGADGGDTGGGSSTPTPAPAPSPSPSAAPTPTPAPAPSGQAPTPTPTPAPAGKGSEGGTWPDNWRETMANGDEKVLKQLGRYASPVDVWTKARALESRLSSGELKSVLPKDAKPEEMAAWRAENGIPETHDKYDLGGFKVAETDKPVVDLILKNAHATNQTPAQVQANIKSFYDVQERLTVARQEADVAAQDTAQETLRAEWGPEFRRNMNLIGNLFDASGSQELKDNILRGRLADGTPIGSSPEALKMILGLALMQNPAGTVVPAGANQGQVVDDEIATIEKFMKSNRKEYDKDEKKQARYRELLGARETLKARTK